MYDIIGPFPVPPLSLQALESEHTIDTLAAMFPKALIREAVLLIHRSGLSLPDLVTKLELYFQSNETFGEWYVHMNIFTLS